MTDESMNTRSEKKTPPQCIHFKFFASLFTFSGIILIPSFPHQLRLFHLQPLHVLPFSSPPSQPPPPPSLLHQGSCGLSETQMNEGPRRASPALPHITYSLSQSHKRDLPAFVPCRQPPGCHGNLQPVFAADK